MKHTILSIIFIGLLMGCASKKHVISTTSFQVEKSDSVRVDSHSITLDSMRVLIVNLQDTVAKGLEPSQQETMAVEYDSPYNRQNRYDPNQANYSLLHRQGNVEHQFFNNIVAHRVTEALKKKTSCALVESRRKTIGRQDAERINKGLNAGLVAVIRNISFAFDSKNEFSSYQSPSDFPHTYSWSSNIVSQSHNTIVWYQSVWDLYWFDATGCRVLQQKTIVQKGGYHAGEEGEPLEKVLSCALKVGDDFISLFK